MEKLDFIDSKFRLALIAAKRAKQLVGGSKKRVDSHSENCLTIAIEEIYAGKVKYRILSEEEMESMNKSFYSGPTIEADESDEMLFGERTDELELDSDDETEPEEQRQEEEDEEDDLL